MSYVECLAGSAFLSICDWKREQGEGGFRSLLHHASILIFTRHEFLLNGKEKVSECMCVCVFKWQSVFS